MDSSPHSQEPPELASQEDLAHAPDFLDAPKPPPRRRRVNPAPGSELTVRNPEIKEVLSVETGDHVPVETVIGTDYYELVKLRMRVRTEMRKEQPLYRCSICGVPVYLCCSQKESRFYFKHRHENGNCPAITRGSLSQKELDARKYNGAKESGLHLKMKEWLVECLQADERFESIAQESRWAGPLTGEWRRPDVRATYKGVPIAFEVQLSTTYLNVIAERRQFYLEQGGLLFWVFAMFDSEHGRMTEDDVFYNNNQNTFVVNADTVVESLVAKEFYLECVWAEPTRNGGTSALHRKKVSFHELTLEPETQRAYFFDFDGRRGQFRDEAEAESQKLRNDFEAWWGATGYFASDRDEAWARFRRRFRQYGVTLPQYQSAMDYDIVAALYSAKNNKPWGQGKKRLVEVAHRIARARKEHLNWFMHAVRKYGRLESMEAEGDPRKWKEKYLLCRKEYKENPAAFEPSRKHQDLVEFLFTELCPLP